MTVLACVVGLSVGQLMAGQEPATKTVFPTIVDAPIEKEWATRSVEEVIGLLPDVGDELIWNAILDRPEPHPATREFSRRLEKQSLTSAQWENAIRVCHAIRVPAKWPKGSPLAVAIWVPNWMGVAQIRAKPVQIGLVPFQAGELQQHDCNFGSDFGGVRVLGVLAPAAASLELDVVVEFGPESCFTRNASVPSIAWQGRMSFPLMQVASFDEVVENISSPEIDAAIKRSIGAGWRDWPKDPNGNSTVVPYVNVAPDVSRDPILAALELDTVFEVICEGKVVEVAKVNLRDECPVWLPRARWGLNYYNSENLVCKPYLSGRWTLRVTGGGEHLTEMPKPAKRWKGQVEITWDMAIAREKERLVERERKSAPTKPAAK